MQTPVMPWMISSPGGWSTAIATLSFAHCLQCYSGVCRPTSGCMCHPCPSWRHVPRQQWRGPAANVSSCNLSTHVAALAASSASPPAGCAQAAIARGLAYAPFADMLWVETSTPDLAEAREFADAIHARFPGKLLAYNCSPSFNWRRHLNDATIATFQKACWPCFLAPVPCSPAWHACMHACLSGLGSECHSQRRVSG